MQSAIGWNLQSSRSQSVAVGIALATVVLDFVIVMTRLNPQNRSALAIVAFAAMVYVTNGDSSSLGLQPRPRQGWIIWIRWSLVIGVIVAACLSIGLGLWSLTGNQVPIYTAAPGTIGDRFLQMCFVAPVLEEMIYRLVLCVSLVSLIGCWPAIFISGFVFGVLHVAYGGPSPENLVGGFFLAWAYLKSDTILLPALLHSAGNLLALGAQVAGWYVLNGGG